MKLFVKDKEFYRETIAIAIPISFQSIITIGVNMMDNIMVGSLGETVLSGVSLANQYISLYHICCMGIAMGASVLTARFWGMKDMTALKQTVTLMLRFCAGLALLFMIPAIISPDLLMRMYTPDEEVIGQGILYYRWIWATFLLQGFSLTCTIVLRSVGQVKLPLYPSIGAFFINVFFNYVFIFGKLGAPRLEIEGAAIGTLFARLFEFAVIVGYFFTRDSKIQYRVQDLRMKCTSLLHEYIMISVPVFVSDGLLALGTTAVAMIMGRISKEFVSANSITFVTQQLSTVLIQGICHAGCIVTGHTLGKGDTRKAQEQAWTFLKLGIIIGIVAGLIILVISEPMIQAYNITDHTKNIARQLMDAMALIIVFQSANSILTKGVLRGGGDTKFLMVADILFLWIVSIPLGALAGLYWHLSAFWIYLFLKIDQVIKAIWCVFRLKSGNWIKTIKGSKKIEQGSKAE